MKKFSLLFAILLLASCGNNPHVTKAEAIVEPKSDSEVTGRVVFTEVEGGVHIYAEIMGLTEGKHGFHIHEHGDCSAHDASSAGGHFDPTKAKHGGPMDPDRHVGDMGNLVANGDGIAIYERIDELMELNGPNSLVDKSVVIHRDEDDLTSQPSGNSGPRIACGEIFAIETAEVE